MSRSLPLAQATDFGVDRLTAGAGNRAGNALEKHLAVRCTGRDQNVRLADNGAVRPWPLGEMAVSRKPACLNRR